MMTNTQRSRALGLAHHADIAFIDAMMIKNRFGPLSIETSLIGLSVKSLVQSEDVVLVVTEKGLRGLIRKRVAEARRRDRARKKQ